MKNQIVIKKVTDCLKRKEKDLNRLNKKEKHKSLLKK